MPTEQQWLELESLDGLTPEEQINIDELRSLGSFPQRLEVGGASSPEVALEETGIPGGQPLPSEQPEGTPLVSRILKGTPETIAETSPYAGAIAGGAAGTKLGAVIGAPGGPPGMAIGGLVGGVVGGGLGYAGGREIEDIILGEQNEGLGNELVEAGANVLEGAKLEAMERIGGELLTVAGKQLMRPVKWAGKKVIESVVGKLQPLGEKLKIESLKAARRLGAPVTIGEATGGAYVTSSENFMRKLFTPKGKIASFDRKRFKAMLSVHDDLIGDLTQGIKREGNPEALGISIQHEVDRLLAGKVKATGKVLDKIRDEVLEKFGSTYTYRQLGEQTQDLIRVNQDKLNTLAGDFFNKAAEGLPNKGEDYIDPSSMIKVIDDAIKQSKRGLTSTNRKTIAELESAKLDILGDSSFLGLVSKRSDINKIISGAETTVGIPGQEKLITGGRASSAPFKKLKHTLDKTIFDFSEQFGGKPAALIKTGIATSKRKFDFVTHKGVQKLINASPEDILDIMLKKGQVSLSRKLRIEMGEAGMGPLRESATNRLLGIGSDEPFTGMALKKRMRAAGDDTLLELMGEKKLAALHDLANQATMQDRIITRLNTEGATIKGLDLRTLDLTDNQFYKKLIRTQNPQKIVDIVYQPGNTKGIKRTYELLRESGQHNKIQDLKATLVESIFEIDPKTGFLDPTSIKRNLSKYPPETLKAAFSEVELRSFDDFANVSFLISPETVGESTPEMIRILAEPFVGPLALVHFSRDGRNLLKKLAKQQAKDIALAPFEINLRKANLLKLLRVGVEAKAKSDIRNLKNWDNLNPGVPGISDTESVRIPELSGAL